MRRQMNRCRVPAYFWTIVRYCVQVSLAAVGSLLNIDVANAQSSTWQVQSGDWSAAGSWNGGVPTSNSTAYINNGGTASITQSGNVCYLLDIGYSGTASSGTIAMTGGALSATGELIGDYGTGSFTQSGGNHSVSGNVTVASASNSIGTYTLQGGTLTVSGWETVAATGTGTFAQSGGTHSIGNGLDVGTFLGCNGTYILNNGLLSNANWLWVGANGTGTFIQSGGTHSIGNGFYLGQNATGIGTYNLSNGLLSNLGWVCVGASGTGVFTQSGGTHSVSSLDRTFVLGGNLGGNGIYNLNGGLLQVPAVTAGAGIGAFNFNGGTLQALENNSDFFDAAANLTVSVQNGGAIIDTQGYSVVVGTNLLQGGSGGLTKIGAGTLMLTGSNTYTGATTIVGGVLNINGPAALSSGSSGVIFSNNTTLQFAAAMTASNPIAIYSGCIGTLDTQGYNVTLGGPISGSGSLTKYGNGMLVLSGSSNYTGGTIISQGTMSVAGGLNGGGTVQIDTGTTLGGSGLVRGNIVGQVGSSIVATGNLSLGDSTSFTGFNHAGTLAVGNNTVTLNSLGFANLGNLTTLAGGVLNAPNGISLGVGCNLSGSGVVHGKIAAGYGSTIQATGNLTLGDSTSSVGFISDGELYTQNNTVTLNSSNAANNKNAVLLGSLTQIGGGSLVAPNGILLSSGFNLVTTDNGGTVSGGTASRFLNLGNVQGPSSASSNWLTFNMLFKGGTGQTAGRIDFAGGFATGDSPGVNYQYGATELGASGTEFDIGGTTPGDNDNNYGQLNILTNPQDLSNHGDLILLPGTEFNIVDWNGFVPTPGETFTVLTWDGSLNGTASLSVDPAFAADGIRFVPQWNSNSLVLTATPEPSTLALLVAGAIGVAAVAWRQRTKARSAASTQDDTPAVLSFPPPQSYPARAQRRAA